MSKIKGAIEVFVSKSGKTVLQVTRAQNKNAIAIKYEDLEAYVLLRLAELEAKAQERERKAFEAARETHSEISSVDEFGERYDFVSTYKTFEDFKKLNKDIDPEVKAVINKNLKDLLA